MQLLFEIESLMEKLSVWERKKTVWNLVTIYCLIVLLHFFNKDKEKNKKKKTLEFSWKQYLYL